MFRFHCNFTVYICSVTGAVFFTCFDSSGIYGTNAYESGVYIGVSRFNHSCRSNAELSWNHKTKQGRVNINVIWVMEFLSNFLVQNYLDFIKKMNGLQANCCILWNDLTQVSSDESKPSWLEPCYVNSQNTASSWRPFIF